MLLRFLELHFFFIYMRMKIIMQIGRNKKKIKLKTRSERMTVIQISDIFTV